MNTRKFTILHSNDIHGDFSSERIENQDTNQNLIGGLAQLSGYINKVRQEEENVLYVIAGDMLQGSMIDSEFKGISTMEIMNYLAPDVVTLGNHEFDYGLPHLLFLEKVANFPIVNANLYIKQYNKRLMQPYIILKRAGLSILFSGIITDKVIDSINQDKLVGSFVSLEEASTEVGKICNAYKNDDIDLTILLTHIGFDSDKQLASLLSPDWGVDMIIGGHSHTVMEQPEKINNILIAQSGTGTNQIGRFDITVDDDTNAIVDYKWQLVPITNENSEPDRKLLEYIEGFQMEIDRKYKVVLCHLNHEHTHPAREIETDLGDLFADAFLQASDSDVVLVGSGSIRVKSFGPMVTLGDLMACFPYNDSLMRFEVTGAQLKQIFSHIMRTENRDGEGECYQVNSTVKVIYNDIKHSIESFTINGNSVDDVHPYTVMMQMYHFNNIESYLSIKMEDVLKNGTPKVVSTSAREVLEEFLKNNHNIGRTIEGRLVYK